jgi:demethylmenaquinone methyltransferase/2-methoxy-6-polyprenyl-1,4-benzoquinol methylase
MIRVTRPGGRIVVLDFGKPPNPVLRTLYFFYLRMGVPVFGLLFCGNAAAYAYILESLHHYPAQTGVREQMDSFGLKDVQLRNLLGGTMSINWGVKTPNDIAKTASG